MRIVSYSYLRETVVSTAGLNRSISNVGKLLLSDFNPEQSVDYQVVHGGLLMRVSLKGKNPVVRMIATMQLGQGF